MSEQTTCQHENFCVSATINRVEGKDGGIEHFSADIRITCEECGVPMCFLGLPRGLDLNGASVNLDGSEGRFAIHPKGQTKAELALGFHIRKEQTE